MNRRKFLSVLSGAAAAVAGGLGLAKSSPRDPLFDAKVGGIVTFGAGKPYEKTLCLWENFDGTPYLLHPIKPNFCWKTLDEIAAEYNMPELRTVFTGNLDLLGGLGKCGPT